MTRGLEVRRGVVVLSLVVAGAAGCAAGRPVVSAVRLADGRGRAEAGR